MSTLAKIAIAVSVGMMVGGGAYVGASTDGSKNVTTDATTASDSPEKQGSNEADNCNDPQPTDTSNCDANHGSVGDQTGDVQEPDGSNNDVQEPDSSNNDVQGPDGSNNNDNADENSQVGVEDGAGQDLGDNSDNSGSGSQSSDTTDGNSDGSAGPGATGGGSGQDGNG